MGLDRSIHRTLIVRILTTAVITALSFLTLVLWVELRNIDNKVADMAAFTAERLRLSMIDHLDTPGLGDHDHIRQILEKPLAAKIRPWEGHFVFVRILDTDLNKVAEASDPAYADIGAIRDNVAKGMDYGMLRERGAWSRDSRVGGALVIHMGSVLRNSAGDTAGYVEGVYAVSREYLTKARLQALVLAVIVSVIVLLTAIILYPVIKGLLGRVSGLSKELLHANMEILNVLGSAIAKRDNDTDIHNYRVTIYSIRLGREVLLSGDEMRALIKGAFLHDVGKIGIRDSILLKPGSLTESEFQEMKQHVRHGLDIVNRSAWLKDAAEVVGGHHERFDGSGYPGGLSGTGIPKTARIFAIADVFDALTSRRPYKEAFGLEESLEILTRGRGSHFDPEILDIFLKIASDLHATYAGRDDSRPREDLIPMGREYFFPGMKM